MERVETRELEYFLAVAEELHFGRAAERLGIAQPPLSRAIGRLERRMGVQLFDRTSRRVRLTAAGAVFLTESRKALTAVDAAVSRAKDSGRAHRLVVAAMHGLEFTELAQEQTVAFLPLDHPLATKPAVSAADVARDALFRAQWPEATLGEIIDQVAMGELIVTAAVSATDRIGSAVVAVPVVDAPPTWLMMTWRPDIPAATRDAFVHTAKNVAAEHAIQLSPTGLAG
jgi:DNA-binding transcriptional LysR family regulator